MPISPTASATARVNVDVRRVGVSSALALLYVASVVVFCSVATTRHALVLGSLSGAALAVCLLWGARGWPLVFVVALALGVGLPGGAFSYELCASSLGVACLATLHAVLGAWLVRTIADLPQPLLAARDDRPEAQLRERTAELAAARSHAEQANRAKTLFLANMSHELFTPLHAVLSYAQLGADAASVKEQRDYFERIALRGQGLLRLLSDLLDLSQLEAGSLPMEFAPHDLTTLVQDALLQMEPSLRTKQLRSEYRRAPDCDHGRATVDPVRIGQVLTNLLGNAVRFSPEGGLISVQLSRASLPDSASTAALEIAISDEGVGIPAAELELVFDKFVESSKTRSNAGGTGLGLAICREIVALHRGLIRASNNTGPGATLRVVLPLTESASKERGTA